MNFLVDIVQIFPNPASSHFMVRTSATKSQKLEITNALGQVIYNTTYLNQTEIQTSNWEDGIYFVHTGNTVKKLIVTH